MVWYQIGWRIPKDHIPEYLLWTHRKPKTRLSGNSQTLQHIRRKQKFPSWCWAGWSSRIGFDLINPKRRMGRFQMVFTINKRLNHQMDMYHERIKASPRFSHSGFMWTQNTPYNHILRCDTRSAPFEVSQIQPVGGGTNSQSIGTEKLYTIEAYLDCSDSQLRSCPGQVSEFMECGRYTPCDPPRWFVGILVIARAKETLQRG